MQHDAAHVRVVIVEQMSHLPVGERGVEKPELEIACKDGGLRFAASLLQNTEQFIDGGVLATGERAAYPVEHAPSRFADGPGREVVVLRPGQMATERFRESRGVGVERLVHGVFTPV